MTEPLTVSVLIPSWRRPDHLEKCLRALAAQSRPPEEIFVVWQADDTRTRDRAEECAKLFAGRLTVLHSPEAGVVPAENLALARSTGTIVALIDDDAYAPPDWLARYLPLYDDSTVGAVGGPAVNHEPDGTPFPTRTNEPVGRLTWYGRSVGNMYDQAGEWRTRGVIEVDHLVGYNMTLRRAAFDRFESSLRRYWQQFELETCLQVKSAGYRILFDFGNVVDHHPTNTAYVPGRSGDLTVKVYNAAYNRAFVLARHSPLSLRLIRLLFLLSVGSMDQPGILASIVAWRRFGGWRRELGVLRRTLASTLAGWRAGSRRRTSSRTAHSERVQS